MAIDYEAVIADLEAKRSAFNAWVDATLQGLRQIQAAMSSIPATQTLNLPTIPSGAILTPPSLTPDAFFGLNLAEAAIKVLQTVKKQQTTRELVDALETANYHHTSQNFVNTVNTALYRRERDEGDVVRIGRNWALAEWYPGRRRGGRRPDESSEAVSIRPSDAVPATGGDDGD
jgi:hypothetical protein